jgi:hypothetical protein
MATCGLLVEVVSDASLRAQRITCDLSGQPKVGFLQKNVIQIYCGIVILEGIIPCVRLSSIDAIDFPWFDEDALISGPSSQSNSD